MVNRLKSLRGAVDPVTLVVVVVVFFGGAKLAGWKPLQVLKRKPPTEQVTKLQEDLVKAQSELEAARAAAKAATEAERAKQLEQVQWGQQMTEGAAASLQRLPLEQRTAETQLAADLLARGNLALAMAVGDLPREKRVEILAIVDKALSHVQAERDEARAALQAKDAELKHVAADRETIKAQLPVLEAKLQAKEADARAVQAELTVKTNEVKIYADKADAKEREAGSLGAAASRLVKVIILMVGGWFFAAYGLPPLLKLMRPGRTKNILRDVTGYATGGLLYRDAKKKLAAKPSQ